MPVPKGNAAAWLVAVVVVLLAASQRCPDPNFDDSVSLLQGHLAVAKRKGGKKRVAISPDEDLYNRLQEDFNKDSPDNLPVDGADQELNAAASIPVQHPEFDAKEISSTIFEESSQPEADLHSAKPGKGRAWWAHRPYPWLTWPMPVCICVASIVTFVVCQLFAISSFRVPRSNPQALPAGEAAMAKDLVEEADDSKQPSAASHSVWSWLALSWANPLFSSESRRSQHDIGSEYNTLQSQGVGMTYPKDDASTAYTHFQACWAQEVMRSKKGQEVRLLQVLWNFVGWRQFLLLSGLMMASFAINCLAMVASVECLLSYVERSRSQNDEFVAVDPFWSSLMVLAICGGMPLVGAAIEELLRVKDAHISARLTAALATAICQKAQHLPVGNLQSEILATPESAQKLIHDAAEASTNATRMLVQCITVPINMVLLLVLLWHRVGISCVFVVIGFVPLVLVSTKFLGAIVPARVTHQVAYEKWLHLFRNAFNAILEVKSCGWEGPLMERISEARSEGSNAIWTMQTMGQQIVTVSVAWPRLVTFGVLLSYSMASPIVDGIALFTCLQVLGYITYLLSAFSLGTTKLKAIAPSATRLEAFLRLPEAPTSQPAQLNMEPSAGLSLNGSFTWRANDKPALRDLDICIPKGTLAAIVGEPGSGKTSLLCAVLGDLYPTSKSDLDQKAVAHTAAYCSQWPWIFAGTIRQNIVLGADEVDEGRYTAAVRAAGLTLDIESFPDGDATMVKGPPGGVLTDSQRARIAWARCAYSSQDLVIMDDVLSTLADAPTAMQHADAVHKRLIHDPLLMGGRTRLVVTQPDATVLQSFGLVLVMEGGRIVEHGPARDVLQTVAFKRLLQHGKAIPQRQKTNAHNDVRLGIRSLEKPSGRAAQNCPSESSTSSTTFSSLLRFLRCVGGRRAIIFLWLIFAAQGLMLLMDISLAQWANEADAFYEVRGAGRSQGWSWLWIYAIFLAISVVLGVSANMVGTSCSQAFSHEIHDKVMHSLLNSQLLHVYSSSRPRVNDVISDLYQADFTVWTKIAGLATMLCGILCPLAYVHAVLPLQFTVMAMPCYLAMSIFLSTYWRILPQLQNFTTKQRLHLYDHILEARDGATSRRAFGQTEGLALEEAVLINNYANSCLLVNCIGPQWLLVRLTACFVPVLTSAALIGVLDPWILGQGSFGLVLVFCISVLQSLEIGVEHGTGMQQELAVAERLHQYTLVPQNNAKTQVILDESPFVFEDAPAVTSETDSADVRWYQEARNLNVQVKSLCVGYGDRHIDVLRGLSLQISAGQKVGVYGAVDSGKSLLLMALLQLVSPRHGTITFNGVDTSKMDAKRLRSLVGLVPQDPILLQGDVLFNMDPLKKHSAKKVSSALHIVGLDSLAQDLETEPRFESAVGRCPCPAFALRERRLLTVARMVLHQPAFLLLDETFLGLDARAQALVRNTMQSAFADSTVLAVARGPESLMGFDQISELKQGVLIDRSASASHH